MIAPVSHASSSSDCPTGQIRTQDENWQEYAARFFLCLIIFLVCNFLYENFRGQIHSSHIFSGSGGGLEIIKRTVQINKPNKD